MIDIKYIFSVQHGYSYNYQLSWTHTCTHVNFIAVCAVALCIYELQQAVCVNSDKVVFVLCKCVCVCFAGFPNC